MVKLIVLVKRKQELSREDFVRQYEEWAPMVLKYFTSMKRYVRNHIIPTPGGKELDFDCITEQWYEDNDALKAAGSFLQSNDGQVVRDNESKFIDYSKMVYFVVDERVSR